MRPALSPALSLALPPARTALRRSAALGLALAALLTAGTAAAQAPAPGAAPRPAQPQRPANPTGNAAASPAPAATPAPPPPPPVSFPGGARSINEEHGDWMVNCGGQDGRKVCTLSQSQGSNQTGRRIFTIELRGGTGDEISGMLLMPFGLRLDTGTRLVLDDQAFGAMRAFNTCIEAGCLAPLTFDAAAARALQRGNMLKVSAETLASGEPVTFNVSLNGFTSALKRAQDLAK